MTTHNVFVYGTLKRDEPNHHWLTKQENGMSTFISEGTTKTKYPLIIATRYNIPFLLYRPGEGNHVKGEIYKVDDLMLSNLDILEEHPKYYVRELDDIAIPGGETIQCWVYFLKKFRPELLKKPHLEDYSSLGSHGLVYLERFKRDPNYNYKPEVTDGPTIWQGQRETDGWRVAQNRPSWRSEKAPKDPEPMPNPLYEDDDDI